MALDSVEGNRRNNFFSVFCKLPTGIKGATDQMLPWKSPNDPKTLPMGILHDYMSCWTTLGPFRYPWGPQNGPKQHWNGPEWLKITRMAQNGAAWPQMTLKHFPWVYYMILCHAGPPWGLFRGPLGPCGPRKRPQGGPWHIIMYYAPEKCFRAIWGHTGTFWVMKRHFG